MNPKGTKWVISLSKWTQKVQSDLSPLKQMNPKGAKWVNGSKRYNVSYLP
jgi:hypothetical protein